MTRNSESKERKARFENPAPFVQIVGLRDPALAESVEDERPALPAPQSEGSGFYIFFLIMLLIGAYLFVGPTAVGTPEKAEPAVPARVAADSLYLRERPGTQHKAHYILPRDWPVTMLEESHRATDGEVWVKVRVETQQGTQLGWVNQKYLRL